MKAGETTGLAREKFSLSDMEYGLQRDKTTTVMSRQKEKTSLTRNKEEKEHDKDRAGQMRTDEEPEA